MALTIFATEDRYNQALESWEWIGLGGRRPACSSLFGDVFLVDNDGAWYLDIVDGTLNRRWRDRSEMETVLATGDGEATFLRSALAASAIERGLVLDGDKIYDFTKPPVLGGAVDAGNLSMIDFVVGINIAGQIHDQLRDRARGTPVAGVTISKDEPTKRRGHWRR